MTSGLLFLSGCTFIYLAGSELLLLQTAEQTATHDKERIAKAAIVAYAANITSFPFYKCRFRTTKGRVKSAQDAIQGRFLNSRYYDCRLIVDGPKDLYEGLSPPPLPNRKNQDLNQGGDSTSYLSDGKLEMCYLPPMRSINLYSPDKPHPSIISPNTPLSMGFIGHRNRFGPDVFLAQPEKYRFSAGEVEEALGRPVVTVRFDYLQMPAGAPRFARTYSLDKGRGHLPVRMESLRNDTPARQVFVTHVRECSNNRWFPERIVFVDFAQQSGDLHAVTEIKLLELDADNRPEEDEFSLIIPAGINVLEFADPRKHFMLKQQEKISVQDLPNLFKMVNAAPSKPRMDTAIPRSSWSPWMRWAGAGAGAALVLGGAFILVRRKLRAS